MLLNTEMTPCFSQEYLVYDTAFDNLECADIVVSLTGRNPLVWLRLYIKMWAGMDGLIIRADVEQYWHKLDILLASYSLSQSLDIYLLIGGLHLSSIQTCTRACVFVKTIINMQSDVQIWPVNYFPERCSASLTNMLFNKRWSAM